MFEDHIFQTSILYYNTPITIRECPVEIQNFVNRFSERVR